MAVDSIKRPVNIHKDYHAHLYFDAATLGRAKQLAVDIANQFGLVVGRVHEKPVGPHSKWSCQVIFSSDDFDMIIPWLEEQRGDMSVFVHGLTGNALDDHTKYAYWLGDSAPLDLTIFEHS